MRKLILFLRGVIELNPDLYKIADNLDKERRQGKVRSAMHGIPILVKDNIATADKMNTACGSDGKKIMDP
jgi:amidase